MGYEISVQITWNACRYCGSNGPLCVCVRAREHVLYGEWTNQLNHLQWTIEWWSAHAQVWAIGGWGSPIQWAWPNDVHWLATTVHCKICCAVILPPFYESVEIQYIPIDVVYDNFDRNQNTVQLDLIVSNHNKYAIKLMWLL